MTSIRVKFSDEGLQHITTPISTVISEPNHSLQHQRRLQDHEQLYESTAHQLQAHLVSIRISVTAVNPYSTEILRFLADSNPEQCYPACQSFCGEVINTGADVSRCAVGDTVCGILSFLSEHSACANSCTVSEFDLVKVPAARTESEAVACLQPAVRSYTALIYHANLSPGCCVLIMSGASSFGHIAIQLALSWGAKVLTTVCGEDERRFVEKNYPDIAQVIDVGGRNSSLVSVVMEETGSLGADIVIDDGVQMFNTDSDSDENGTYLAKKHDIISCLATNGKWITSQLNLQLDPPNSLLLSMKNASLHFLFEHAWTASRSVQGKYLHILNDIMDKLASGAIKSHVGKTVQFDDAERVLPELPARSIGATLIYTN